MGSTTVTTTIKVVLSECKCPLSFGKLVYNEIMFFLLNEEE